MGTYAQMGIFETVPGVHAGVTRPSSSRLAIAFLPASQVLTSGDS